MFTLVPYLLRCEALDEPLALQTAQPHLSWKLRAGAPELEGLSQSGYRILVASSPERLAAHEGDLWDTGRVASAETFGIRYSGRPLGSRAHAWWKVKVWDQAGKPSDWSQPARFSTGLQRAEDWSAKWIHGETPTPPPSPLEGASWIWAGDGDPAQYPVERRAFSRDIELTAGDQLKMTLSADDAFAVFVNGALAARFDEFEGWRRPQELDLTAFVRAGFNEIRIEAENKSTGPAGVIAVLSSGGRRWTTGPDWKADRGGVRVLAPFGAGPWGRIGPTAFIVSPALHFRRAFSAPKKVARAIAYTTALGIVDLKINGRRVTDDLFSPGWTDYRKRVHYTAHDVTALIQQTNDVEAVLGQGWFSGYVGWSAQRDHYGKTTMVKAQIEVEYADGSRDTWATGDGWAVGTGPTLDEHFLHGEKHDARLSFVEQGAAKVGEWDAPLEAFNGVPVQVEQTLAPRSITPSGPGKWIVDFGQNLSGFTRLRLREERGTKVTLRHAERLDADGELYTTNLRLAQAVDEYTCAGEGEEVWNPRFTFHGFQYVEVSGLAKPPQIEALSITSAAPRAGALETSDPMLNQLVSNAWWTQKMNFIDVPTDCPQRDERLGWTGDAQVYIRTAAYFADVQSFFTKWLISLDDAQGADGNYPKVAPVISGLDDGGPAWAEAGVICPMETYRAYGDRALLARHYPNMKRYVDFLVTRSKPNLMPPDQYHAYGDWLSINAETPNDVIYSAYFALSAQLVSEAARELGMLDDAERYAVLHRRLRRAFQDGYVSPNGEVRGKTQCAYVLVLAFDLLEPEQAKLAADHLVKDIESRDWHLSTGFVGTRDVMHVLVKIGRPDVAYRLLHNTTFPSWGFPIQHGATSIWERWDGWTPEKGFQDPGMNSFAHYAYGAVAGWMFEHLGGISPLEPGYARVLIAPLIDPRLTFAKASYDSVRGPIRVEWRIEGGELKLHVELPPNTTAEIRIPQPDGSYRRVEAGSGAHTWSESWKAN